MNIKPLRLVKSGFAVVGTVLGFSLLNALSPIELLSLTQWGQMTPQALAQNTPDAEEGVNVRVYQAASPAVVSIDVGDATGSGSIISPDGLVLTNAHVVNEARGVKVTLADGRTFDADVVGFGDAGLDLAVVKIRGQNNLPTVRFAAPNSIEVGQRAFAIGNPFGRFQGTFTTGIVSRIDRDRGLIQTDAAINPGNSGGPLLNSQGEMIGVNSAIFAPTRGEGGNIGIGFAISVEKVQPFLVAVREGRAPRTAQAASPFFGEKSQPITLNSAVQGKLDRSSSTLPSDNSYFNAYTFQGRAGQRVVIEMNSNELDPYLILLASDGQDIAQDDDGGGGSTSRVEIALPANGTYTILANSSNSGETGNYNLRVAAASPGTQPTPPRSPQQSPRQTPQQTPQPRSPQQTGRVLLREQGRLGTGSPVLQSDGSFYQQYTFQGNAGQTVTISLNSPDFDTYLIVVDANDHKIGENDDVSANDSNSELTLTLPASGTYRVIANAYDRSGQGSYTLVIR
jgi:S1-C subfamily serine protease